MSTVVWLRLPLGSVFRFDLMGALPYLEVTGRVEEPTHISILGQNLLLE